MCGVIVPWQQGITTLPRALPDVVTKAGHWYGRKLQNAIFFQYGSTMRGCVSQVSILVFEIFARVLRKMEKHRFCPGGNLLSCSHATFPANRYVQ